MRVSLLVLKSLVIASLLVQPTHSLASSAKSHSGKNGLKKHGLQEVGNVWDRVRAGMQIPRSFAEPAPLETVVSSLVGAELPQKTSSPAVTLAPPQTSTATQIEENRPRLHSILGANPQRKISGITKLSTTDIQKQITDYVNSATPESSATVRNRLHTQISFHPESNVAEQPSAQLLTARRVVLQPHDKKLAMPSKPQARIVTIIAGTNKEVVQKKVSVNTSEKVQQDARLISANERISKHISWYAQRPSYLQQVAERARPYLYHIVNELAANHLPSELALLPIVESAYQPTAESAKSAAGLWQFIPSTGLDFDLTQSDSYDKRLDIEASTQAAIRYLSFLKRHFNGDWLLALAAYNSGQGRVDDAIASNRANGLPTDYWSLHLPEETQEYVPRFLALSSIFADPANYGVKLPAVRNEPYFVKVKVDRKFDIAYLANKDLAAVAELANVSYEQFMQLNPGYLKPTLETDSPFTLLLPASNAKQLSQHLSHVAQFVAEPSVLMVKTPEQKNRVSDESPVSVLSFLNRTSPNVSSPLLSLNPNQTTPRINVEPVLTDSRSSMDKYPQIKHCDNDKSCA